MIPLTLAQIDVVTAGTVSGDPSSCGVLDSRFPHPRGLFVAIVGERVDGHSFAAQAHAVLGSRPTYGPPSSCRVRWWR